MAYKFCPECGCKLDGVYKFCPECGFRLDERSSNNNTKTSKTTESNLFSLFDNMLNQEEEYNQLLEKALFLCKRKQFVKATEVYEELISKDYNDVNAYIGLIRVSSNNFTVSNKATEANLNALFSVLNKESKFIQDENFISYLKEVGLYNKFDDIMGLEKTKKNQDLESRKKALYKEKYGNKEEDLFSSDSLIRLKREKEIEESIIKENARKEKEREQAIKKEKEEEKHRLEEEKRKADEAKKKADAELAKQISVLILDKTQTKVLGVKSLRERKFVIPDFITSIDAKAFKNNGMVEEIVISENVLSIGAGAFENCTRLKKVNLPIDLEKLEKGMFKNCGSLEKIRIPRKILEIEEETFYGCKALKEIALDRVNKIGKRSFANCTSLETAFCSCNVECIEEEAFMNCKSLRSFGGAFFKEIKEKAFADCTSLSSINLSNLEFIGDFALLNTSLQYVLLSDKLKHVGVGAFAANGTISGFTYLPPKEKSPKYVVKEKFLCEFNKSGMWNTYKIVAAPQKGQEIFVKSNVFNKVAPYAFYKSNAEVIEFESNTRGLTFENDSFAMCPNLKCIKWINTDDFTKDFIKDCPKFDTLTFNAVPAHVCDFTSGKLRTFTQLKKVVFEESLNFKYNSSSFPSSTKVITKPKGFKNYEI